MSDPLTITPAHFAPARANPEAPGFEARLRHAGGWQALSITASPQVVELTLTNRMGVAAALDGAVVDLLVRPGVLSTPDAIALAPESDPAWHLTLATLPAGDLCLRCHAARARVVAPGETVTLRFTGVSAAAEGGSRATRVEVAYAGILSETGTEIAGQSLVHLPVLRRHAPEAAARPRERAGSAVSGPFLAGLVAGGTVLNDGKSGNVIRLALMNVSGRPLPLVHGGDAATRLRLSWRQGLEDMEFGLLASEGSHLGLRPPPPGPDDTPPAWRADRHTLRRVAPGAWGPGETLELVLDLYTGAQDGAAELRLSYENLPGHDDGDLALAVTLAPMARVGDALHVVRPLELRGSDARLSFHVAEEGRDILDPGDVPEISVARGAGDAGALVIRAPRGLDIDAPVTIRGASRGKALATISDARIAFAGPISAELGVTATGAVRADSLDVGSWRLMSLGTDSLTLSWSSNRTVTFGRNETKIHDTLSASTAEIGTLEIGTRVRTPKLEIRNAEDDFDFRWYFEVNARGGLELKRQNLTFFTFDGSGGITDMRGRRL